MRVSKYTNTFRGALLMCTKDCSIGSYTYSKGTVFRVIEKSSSNTDNIRIAEISKVRQGMVEWIDIGTDERNNNYRLRFLYKNEMKRYEIN